ncbi:MAG: TlpA family protein disulfide reductase [Thermoanaerobaculia bacterium]|nr:TlpA family protein disulfide reductase [Thermoanaerobaculia bacterium]
MTSAILEPPLVFFLLAGLGSAVLAVTGLIDVLRKARAAAKADPSESRSLRFEPRLLGHLIVTGFLGFISFHLLSNVVEMAPRFANAMDMIGSPAPDVAFTRIDSEGQPDESLGSMKGDVVLLNLWATWCPPCRKEMPDLDRLQKDLGPRGLKVIHLSFEDLAVLRSWLAQNPMSTHHGRIEDVPFPAPALPTSLVIDRQGTVRDVMVGGQSYGAFERAVTPWL